MSVIPRNRYHVEFLRLFVYLAVPSIVAAWTSYHSDFIKEMRGMPPPKETSPENKKSFETFFNQKAEETQEKKTKN